jgi:hypothetical protein
MLTKNVGNTPKYVDGKMSTTLSKNVEENCSQHFRKMMIKKILTTVQKIINKENKKVKAGDMN